MKRYQNESKIPQRFQTVTSGESAAAERALYRTRDTPASDPATVPPMFRTSYSELGQFEANRHTAAHTYHGLNTRHDRANLNKYLYRVLNPRFTAKISRHGMYRNHSVNL